MALSFPLTLAAFLDRLPVQEVRLSCAPQVQATGLAGGEILTAEVAPALWEGAVSLAPMKARQAEEIAGLLAALAVPGASFFAYRKNQIGPAADPLGATLGAASVVINAVDVANDTLRLSGLPAGYQISAGDLLAFSYGASPVRYALHRAVASAVADGSGIAGHFPVVPHIRAGVTAGAAVSLLRPSFKAVLVPGSVDYGATARGITAGMAFAFRQTLR